MPTFCRVQLLCLFVSDMLRLYRHMCLVYLRAILSFRFNLYVYQLTVKLIVIYLVGLRAEHFGAAGEHRQPFHPAVS